MSDFENKYYKKPLDGYDDSDCYYGKDDLEHAYNAGAAAQREKDATLVENAHHGAGNVFEYLAAVIRNQLKD